jgi:hypothetical protein
MHVLPGYSPTLLKPMPIKKPVVLPTQIRAADEQEAEKKLQTDLKNFKSLKEQKDKHGYLQEEEQVAFDDLEMELRRRFREMENKNSRLSPAEKLLYDEWQALNTQSKPSSGKAFHREHVWHGREHRVTRYLFRDSEKPSRISRIKAKTFNTANSLFTHVLVPTLQSYPKLLGLFEAN